MDPGSRSRASYARLAGMTETLLPPDRISLHQARRRRGRDHAVLALDRADAAEGPGALDLHGVAARAQARDGLSADAILDQQLVGLGEARIEALREVA